MRLALILLAFWAPAMAKAPPPTPVGPLYNCTAWAVDDKGVKWRQCWQKLSDGTEMQVVEAIYPRKKS